MGPIGLGWCRALRVSLTSGIYGGHSVVVLLQWSVLSPGSSCCRTRNKPCESGARSSTPCPYISDCCRPAPPLPHFWWNILELSSCLASVARVKAAPAPALVVDWGSCASIPGENQLRYLHLIFPIRHRQNPTSLIHLLTGISSRSSTATEFAARRRRMNR
jgi:hypothetical protein